MSAQEVIPGSANCAAGWSSSPAMPLAWWFTNDVVGVVIL